MASGRGVGGRGMVSEQSEHTTGGGDLTAALECVSALRPGPVAGCLAETPCTGRGHHCTLCRRFRARLSRGSRRETLPGSTPRAGYQVWRVTAPGENAADRVRALCGRTAI